MKQVQFFFKKIYQLNKPEKYSGFSFFSLSMLANQQIMHANPKISMARSNGWPLQIWLFRRFKGAEQSLFAQGHVKMIWFFFRPWHPSAIHLFNDNFVGTHWWDSLDFCVNTTKGSRSTIYQIFSRRKVFFRATYKRQKVQFSEFLEGKGYIFVSCFCRKPGNANVLALFDGAAFSWAACYDVFAEKRKFLPKIYPKHLVLPISHCVSHFWRPFSTNAFVGSVFLNA